jgi:hypothetical protein
MVKTKILFGALIISVSADAHHSPNLHFDRGDIVEISGTLTEVSWRNPHTTLVIETIGENGQQETWVAETRAALQMMRTNLTPEIFNLGDELRLAGFRGRRNRTAMFVTNILLTDGSELIAENFTGLRWSNRLAGTALGEYQAEKIEGELRGSDTSIFRVWSRDGSILHPGIDETERALWIDEYPLTELAREAQASWDPVADNPYILCQNAMPAIMDQGFPLEFVQQGDTVFLHLEELDTVRRINVGPNASPPTEGGGPLGYSVGHWESETFVVTTTNIDWPWFDQRGIPQDRLHLVERFALSADGQSLGYELTATDPAIFTEPVVLTRRWIYVPGEEITPYNCDWNREDL